MGRDQNKSENDLLAKRLTKFDVEEIRPRNAETPLEQRLLRPRMLEALVAYKPVQHAEFLAKVPEYLRKNTAPSEGVFLTQIFALIQTHLEDVAASKTHTVIPTPQPATSDAKRATRKPHDRATRGPKRKPQVRQRDRVRHSSLDESLAADMMRLVRSNLQVRRVENDLTKYILEDLGRKRRGSRISATIREGIALAESRGIATFDGKYYSLKYPRIGDIRREFAVNVFVHLTRSTTSQSLDDLIDSFCKHQGFKRISAKDRGKLARYARFATSSSMADVRHSQGRQPTKTPARKAEKSRSVQKRARKRTSIGRNLSAVSPDQLMSMLRKVCRSRSLSREAILKLLASEIGFIRLSRKRSSVLSKAVNMAVRRQVLHRDGDVYRLSSARFATVSRETLDRALRANTVKGRVYRKDEVLDRVTKHLGFTRKTESVHSTFDKYIVSARRRKLIRSDRRDLSRVR